MARPCYTIGSNLLSCSWAPPFLLQPTASFRMTIVLLHLLRQRRVVHHVACAFFLTTRKKRVVRRVVIVYALETIELSSHVGFDICMHGRLRRAIDEELTENSRQLFLWKWRIHSRIHPLPRIVMLGYTLVKNQVNDGMINLLNGFFYQVLQFESK